MNPIKFIGCNKLLVAPDSPNPIDDLPIFSDGNACVSVWALTEEDIARIVSNKYVVVTVLASDTQPPISLEAGTVPLEDVVKPEKDKPDVSNIIIGGDKFNPNNS